MLTAIRSHKMQSRTRSPSPQILSPFVERNGDGKCLFETESLLFKGESESIRVHGIYSKLKSSNFDLSEIAALETSQLLEGFLWPQFPPSSDLPSSEADIEWSFLGLCGFLEGGKEECDGDNNEHEIQTPVETDSTDKVQSSTNTSHLAHNARSMQQLEHVRAWVLLITFLINEKFRQRVEVWSALGLNTSGDESSYKKFKLFFYLAWFLFLQPENFHLSMQERSGLLQLFIHVFQSLEQDSIRRVCMPLCGLPAWMHLGPKQLSRLFDTRPELSSLWKGVQKRYRLLAKRCKRDAEFNTPVDVGLLDRFYFLDRDAFHAAFCQFLKLVEVDLPQKINSKNLRSIGAINAAASLFSTMGTGSDFLLKKKGNRSQYLADSENGTDRVVSINDASAANLLGQATNDVSNFDSSQVAAELRNENPDDLSSDDFLFCERFLEFFIDLLSQLPTRRIIHPVFSSHQIIPRLRLSPLFRHSEASLIRQLTEILAGFESFEIDEVTGEPLDNKSLEMRNYEQLKELQLIFFTHFQHVPELKEAALGPISAYNEPRAIHQLFSGLNVTLLLRFAHALGLVDASEFGRTALGRFLHPLQQKADIDSSVNADEDKLASYIEVHKGTKEYEEAHRLMLAVLENALKTPPNQLTQINKLPLFPTETLLWDPNLVPAEHYRGNFSLALPKLNLQFLTIRDYLLRNFHLFRLETAYEIREDLEDAVYRMKPILAYTNTGQRLITSYSQESVLETQFRGHSKMACPIESFAIVLVKSPALGSDVPIEVRGEITVNLSRTTKESRREWDALRQFDVLFLLAVRAPLKPFDGRPQDLLSVAEFPEKFGVIGVRGCEVVEVLDEEGQSISDPTGAGEPSREPFGDTRTYRVLLDPYQYQHDLSEMVQEEGKQKKLNEDFGVLDIYSALNLVVRRKAAENNFKAILQTIRQLMNDTEHTVIPSWLHDLFLGYGDPSSAQYFNLPTELSTVDFVDTFLDNEHIQESFFPSAVNISVVAKDGYSQSEQRGTTDHPKPYLRCVLSFERGLQAPSEKNDRTSPPTAIQPREVITVHPYTIQSRGPYTQCKVKMNKIRFTPSQVEAIRSGVNSGLTLIVGPPGTGKTDTAVQITHLLYKNFPDQRILIVAHSNQALNDLFEKVAALDIDERYLLRLGMGEKELRVASDRSIIDAQKKDFSKWGRVNYMLQRRIDLLKEVDRLGQTLRITGDFGASCETAIQFYRSHIASRIQRFRRHLERVGREGKGLRVLLRDMRLKDGEQNKAMSRLVVQTSSVLRRGKNASTSVGKRRGGKGKLDRVQEKEAVKANNIETEREEEEEEEEEEEQEGKTDPNEYVQRRGEQEEDGIEIELPSNRSIPLAERKQVHKSFEDIDDDACVAFREGRRSVVEVLFPFSDFFDDIPNGLFHNSPSGPDYEMHLEIAEGCFVYLGNMFKEIEECRAFELLRTLHDRGNYLLTRHAKIIAMTCTHAALVRQQMIDMRLRYDTLIMEEAAQVLEVETFVPMVLQKTESGGVSRLKRVVLIGDHNQLPPVVKNRYGRLDQSMFTRFIRLQVPFVQLDKQGRCRPSIRELFSWRYTAPALVDLPIISTASEYKLANAGFAYDYQFINVEDYEGRGENSPLPHHYQNRGEAEYATALFMYMRLLKYPAEKIAILTTYNSQKALLKEVIQQRCAWNPAIGWPSIISTVDKFQGQQNDYIILSLVRTRSVGHLRDVRRLIVAVSRARLGLYVLGRMKLFGRCLELERTFNYFRKRPIKLALNLQELNFEDHSGRTVSITGPVTLVDDVYGMWQRVQERAIQELSHLQQPPAKI